jgi:cobalamin biosynthesis protein CobD/CbiB
MATATSLLAQIDAAIEALLTGGASSYSIGNRSVTKLDLGDLFEQRRLLQMQVQRESGVGAFSLAKLGRRR